MSRFELCSQEIEDNKINEFREANFLKHPPNNNQILTKDNSQTMQKMTGNPNLNATKTGAIPKTGFSYLNNSTNVDFNKAFQKKEKESANNTRLRRQASEAASQSSKTTMNSESLGSQPRTQVNSNNEVVTMKTPRKLKPEAFSFLNKLPQGHTENESDRSEERKNMILTTFSHAEKLNISHSQGDSHMILDGCSDGFTSPIPSAPPLQNTSNNYELIMEDSFSEFDLPISSSTIVNENEKPPLPTRPPPVFKYPPETFSTSRSSSEESTNNLSFSKPILQSAPAKPNLGHSISSPYSGLKNSKVATDDNIQISKVRNRRSLPAIPVQPTIPRRPLPPLPNADFENVRIKTEGVILKSESPDSANDNKVSEPPTISPIFSLQTNQFSECGSSAQHTVFKEPMLEEQLISSPQQRLAQILTSQTSVTSSVLITQQKIASAIASRVVGSQKSSVSRLQKTEEPEFENDVVSKQSRMITRNFLESDAEHSTEGESEQQDSYLEAKEAIIPRLFTDHETLINSMNRPALPQKAPPMQRSVSCNSLVQSIKDLSFSVWNKPEKKRNSDVVSLPKKNSRTTSLTSSATKVKSTAPSNITFIPTNIPSEVSSLPKEENVGSLIDEKDNLQEQPWFHEVEAKEGQLRLLSVGQDGTFLIRPSSRPTEDIQNTMCIFYSGKVRNLHIKTTSDGRYILGTKRSRTFSSLTEMINYHKETPVEILPQGSTSLKPQTYRILLRETPPKQQKLFAIV